MGWLIDPDEELVFVYFVDHTLAVFEEEMPLTSCDKRPSTLGNGYELDAIAAVILGGTSFTGGIGTIPSTLLSALIIAVLNNGLTLLRQQGLKSRGAVLHKIRRFLRSRSSELQHPRLS